MKKFINEKFINKFEGKDKEIIVKYFEDLNNSIYMSQRDTVLFNEDFEKAITYYLNYGYSLKEAMKLISIDNLGIYYKDTVDNWYPLDNAAKVYPLAMKESWMNVFRLSYYLKENIVPELFQIALTFTIKRFPTFRTSIRKGFFWNYIDGIKKRFHVYRDNRLPCSYINVSNIGKQSFKAVYYKNRISVEFFHILTDGYGGVVFLSSLVNEYIRLLGNKVKYNDLVFDPNSIIREEELIDEFTTKESSRKTNSLVDSKALELDGKLSNIRPCQLIHFDINIKDIKRLCKLKDCSVTELILAFMFLTCSYCTSKDGYVKIQVPVNMRKFNNEITLRNYSLYASISIKKSDITNIDELLPNIKYQMKNKTSKDKLNETMNYTNKLVNSIKYIPLFIKKPIARAVYGFLGDKVITTVLSNLGDVKIPDEMKKYVEKMDFSLGTGITNRALFSVVTCNDILTLSISKFTTNSAIENSMYNLFKQYGINVNVYGSEVYGTKK